MNIFKNKLDVEQKLLSSSVNKWLLCKSQSSAATVHRWDVQVYIFPCQNVEQQKLLKSVDYSCSYSNNEKGGGFETKGEGFESKGEGFATQCSGARFSVANSAARCATSLLVWCPLAFYSSFSIHTQSSVWCHQSMLLTAFLCVLCCDCVLLRIISLLSQSDVEGDKISSLPPNCWNNILVQVIYIWIPVCHSTSNAPVYFHKF